MKLVGNVSAIASFNETSEYCLEFAPAKGGKTCKKGIKCGDGCIAANKVCRKSLSPDAAKKTKAVKAKLGGKSAIAPTVSQELASAIASGDFDKVLALSSDVRSRAKELATIHATKIGDPDTDSIFREGLNPGNGRNNDWIMKAIQQDLGYDALPQKLTSKALAADVKKGGLEMFRAPTSNPANTQQRVAEFTDGTDLYTGRGIYGHGTYTGAVKPGINRKDAVNAALNYGSGMIRMSYKGKSVKQSDLVNEMNADLAKIDAWHSQKRDAALNAGATSSELKAIDIGRRNLITNVFGDSGESENLSRYSGSKFYDTPSARYAALKGYDGIDLDQGYPGSESFFVLLNRGATKVQDGVYTGK